MTDPGYSVLIADADPSVRRDLSTELCAMGLKVFEAADGRSALRTVEENDIRVVLCELYLKTGLDADLITAIRSNKLLKGTRTVAYTRFKKSEDRDWAKRAGADAYLRRPVLSDRLRDVVARVATSRRPRLAAVTPIGADTSVNRRDSLDGALVDIENGRDLKTRSIIVGRGWWDQLSHAEQSTYRKRARTTGARLLSSAKVTDSAVHVRTRTRPNDGPYRGRPEQPQA